MGHRYMGVTQNHCRGEKGTERGQTLSSASENVLFRTKGQRGNTIVGMFSFAQLWKWMLRFGVTHTDRHWAYQLSASPPKPPSSTPGNYNFLPHSSPCNFVLFLRSCFTNSFVKPHKSLLSPVKPSLGKQWRGNFPFYTQRGITEKAISFWGYSMEADRSKPQPQWDVEVSVSKSQLVCAGNSQTQFILFVWVRVCMLIMNSFLS